MTLNFRQKLVDIFGDGSSPGLAGGGDPEQHGVGPAPEAAQGPPHPEHGLVNRSQLNPEERGLIDQAVAKPDAISRFDRGKLRAIRRWATGEDLVKIERVLAAEGA